METVFVEGGTFTMGAMGIATPTHSVTLTRDFYMGKYEVTQSQWKTVMGSAKRTYDYGVGDNFPVYYTSWYDSIGFCNKLSERGGKHKSPFLYSGSDTVGDVAWYYYYYYYNSGDNGTSTNYKSHALGTKAPNALGLYDMSGNVWEWCWDWYGAYSNVSQTDPTGASEDSGRVIRGGSFINYDYYCRVAFRINYDPDFSNVNLGFRVVRSSPLVAQEQRFLNQKTPCLG